jgi:hypothetical protein
MGAVNGIRDAAGGAEVDADSARGIRHGLSLTVQWNFCCY